MANNALRKGRGKRAMEAMSDKKGPQLVRRGKNNRDEDAPLAIQISPQNPSVAEGLTLALSATYQDKRLRDVYWESSDPTIASIDPEKGVATGVSVGSVAITAIADEGRAVGSLVLNVTPAQLQSITITPANATFAAGGSQQFTALGNYSNKTRSPIASNVAWSSSSANVTIDGTGLATSKVAGSASITASSGGVTSSQPATLTVGPAVLASISIAPLNANFAAGLSQQFTAAGTDSAGNPMPLANVQWSSSSPNVTIDANGLATSNVAGSATITATSGGIPSSQPANLTVNPPVLTGITISPANASIKTGQTQQFSVLGAYTDNSSSPITSGVTWSSLAPSVASINSAGMATGVAIGSTTISANYGGLPPAKASLNVPAPVLKSIALAASQPYVGAGQTLQISITATYQDNSTQNITPSAANTQWSASPDGLVTINAAGLATGVSCGQVNITATYTDTSGSRPNTLSLNVVPNFTDLGAADTQAFMNAKSRVNQLLTAFERRGNLSDAEIAQLKDGLELVTQYVNNNPSTPIPNFNAASKAGNNVSDLELLGLSWNVTSSAGPGSAIGTGSGKANVIDDTFRAIGDYLYGPPPLAANGVSLEHDPGTFPVNGANPPTNPPGLTYDQMRMAAVYGYAQSASASAPTYRTDKNLVTQDDNRRNLFNQTVEAADADFRTNAPLYSAVLAYLIQNSRPPQIKASDLAKVVSVLVSQGITAGDKMINTWIVRALDAAQNVGQAAPPSQIDINLPDLEQNVSNFEIISENIFALQPAYFCSMLEELKVFQVVEKLVELFQNGVLPVVKGRAGNLLFDWWKNAALRVSESERRGFYARALGFPGGDADSPNREFKDLFMRFVSAVSSFVRQNTVDNLLRSNIPGAISQQQVRKSARDLATNISAHGYGIAYPMATELQKEINQVMAILKNDEIENAYGAKDMWQLVDQVAGLELGGAKNSVKYRTMASAGATVFAWLAQKAQLLASNSYVPVLDITQLQLPPSYSSAPTTNPSDFDLVGACDQWLAVTGTQEDSVEHNAQPVESPVMPSRPIQIPSIARDMLESVGVPAMAYAGGKTNGSAYPGNWRYNK